MQASAVSLQAKLQPQLPIITTIPYTTLEQRPSLDFVPFIPTIIKTEEEQLPNDPSNAESRAISVRSHSRHSRPSSKSLPLASSNHNFQKHTVVTIRKMTRRLPSSFGNSPAQLVAQQMWNIFLASGVKSKRMLVVLFGQAQLQEEKYKDLLKGCFFGELCNYEQNIVRAAQSLLRERVAALLTPEAVKENIESSRHIRMRENFYAYFMEFAEMLRRGPLVKFRINSTACQRILDRVETSSSLQSQRKARRRGGQLPHSRGRPPSE